LELGDAIQRILRRHWRIIALAVVVGLAIPVVAHTQDGTRYTATSRLVIDASDPKNAQASTALADAAQGIVTSPGRVATALAKAHATRNVTDFAAKDVKIKVVGTSGVIDLSVTDPRPTVATVVANDLARQLVQAREQVAGGDLPQLIESLNAQISAVTQRIADLNAASGVSAATVDARAAQAGVLKLQHDAAVKDRSDLERQRQAVIQQLGRPGAPQSLLAQQAATLDAQINATNQRISQLEAASAAVADPQRSPSDVLRLQHDEAVQERSDLQAQRQRLVESQALRPKVAIIDPARQPTSPAPSGLGADLVLGGLLGLALGIAIAAVLEALRPSVVGSEALARELHVPVLGKLSGPPTRSKPLDDDRLGAHLRLAANGAGVSSVRLVSAGPELDLERMAESLGAAAGLPRGEMALATAQLPIDRGHGPSWGMPVVASTNGAGTSAGLVLVAPSMLSRSDLDPIVHLLAMTHWMLLGVITYESPSRFRRRPRPVRMTTPPTVVTDVAPRTVIRTP
jgi:capsular polysaccharide biosynthesis protein